MKRLTQSITQVIELVLFDAGRRGRLRSQDDDSSYSRNARATLTIKKVKLLSLESEPDFAFSLRTKSCTSASDEFVFTSRHKHQSLVAHQFGDIN